MWTFCSREAGTPAPTLYFTLAVMNFLWKNRGALKGKLHLLLSCLDMQCRDFQDRKQSQRLRYAIQSQTIGFFLMVSFNNFIFCPDCCATEVRRLWFSVWYFLTFPDLGDECGSTPLLMGKRGSSWNRSTLKQLATSTFLRELGFPTSFVWSKRIEVIYKVNKISEEVGVGCYLLPQRFMRLHSN